MVQCLHDGNAEQAQSDLLRLIDPAQRGEEVVITREGRVVAKLTGVPPPRTTGERRAWLAKLADLRARLSTGKSGPTVSQILDEDRGD